MGSRTEPLQPLIWRQYWGQGDRDVNVRLFCAWNVSSGACFKRMFRDWEMAWERDRRGRSLYRTTPRPTRKVLDLSIPEALNAILVQNAHREDRMTPFPPSAESPRR